MVKKTDLKINFIYSACFQILDLILPLITAPYVARVLGAAPLGIYAKTQAIASYFYMFGMLGVKNYGNRAIAKSRDDPNTLNKTFWEIYIFQISTAFLFTIVYMLFCIIYIHEYRKAYILQVLYVVSGMVDINWFYFGLEKFKVVTIKNAIIRIVSAACIFVFIRDASDTLNYIVIIAAGHLFSSISLWPFVLNHVNFVWPTWQGVKSHIKPNLFLFWPIIAISLYNIMDKIMLGYFSTNEEVAYYSNSEKIVNIPTTLIVALDNVIMPRMSNLYTIDINSNKIKILTDSVMMFTMFMSSAMVFGVAGLSSVFAPWFYGSAFERCGYFIFLLSPVIIFKGWAGALRTQFIIPSNRDNIYVISLTAGAIVNLLINFVLIPRMNGVGAIIGTIVAEFTVCCIQFFWCRLDIDIKNYLFDGFSFCLIGTVMYFLVKALSHIGNSAPVTMAIQIVCGGLLYVLMGCFYMIKIRKFPILVNEGLKILRVRYRFKS